jgi:hypothetical protein
LKDEAVVAAGDVKGEQSACTCWLLVLVSVARDMLIMVGTVYRSWPPEIGWEERSVLLGYSAHKRGLSLVLLLWWALWTGLLPDLLLHHSLAQQWSCLQPLWTSRARFRARRQSGVPGIDFLQSGGPVSQVRGEALCAVVNHSPRLGWKSQRRRTSSITSHGQDVRRISAGEVQSRVTHPFWAYPGKM